MTADDDILTSEEAAKLLRVARATLLGDCRAGLVPCQRVGRAWRFSRRALLAWLNETPAPGGQEAKAPAPDPQPADPPAPKAKGKRTSPKQGDLC